MFLLSTFVDQERWKSSFEPLLYPTGLSFYRPFSYRQSYFQPESVATDLSDRTRSREFLSKAADGYFGIRFHDKGAPEHHKRFVPLRRVKLVAVDGTDGVNLFFQLGAFIKPSSRDGVTSLPEFDLSGHVADVTQTKLFIQLDNSRLGELENWQTVPDFPGDIFWDGLERSLSEPARAKVANVTLLRLIRASRRGGLENLEPEDLDPARHLWGYRLRQRNVYDLVLGYYRILPSGTAAGTQQQYCIGNPSEEIQSSSKFIPVSGNYRTEDLWVSPLVSLEAPVRLLLEPRSTSNPAHSAELSERMIGLKIPVIVDSMDWPPLRKVNLLVAALFLLGAFIGLSAYSTADEGMQKILLVVIATLFSVAANAFKDVISFKR